MVKKLSQAQEIEVHKTLDLAAQGTSAKIKTIIRLSSSVYQEFVLLYGLILGSLISLIVWFYYPISLPWFLALQFGIIIIIDLVPSLRRLCVQGVPKRIRRHRAAEMAYREYHALHEGVPKDEAFVLFFVSLAERYVHIITNPVVHQKIPENWDAITNAFTASIRKEGVQTASIAAIEKIVKILQSYFPIRSH